MSHRQLQVESPAEVAQQTRNALRYIDPENLILTSDCGFGRQGCNRMIAFSKAAAIAQGAGFRADPELQVDVPKRERVVRIS